MPNNFLPIHQEDLRQKGIQQLDIILVSGDAYVDHPSYGTAVIGRFLEKKGFSVGVIAQPDWRSTGDFQRLGAPRLFFGVSSGNLDSMLAHYTSSRHRRKEDLYSPGGRSGLRPDRAVIVYTNRIKQLFPDIPVVLGGIEASLRRFAHYDFLSDTIRRSILIDSKADILVYGMGERQVFTLARELSQGKSVQELSLIPGTTIVRSSLGGIEHIREIPSFEEVIRSQNAFCRAFQIISEEQDPFRGKAVIQKHDHRFVIQAPPAIPLQEQELDEIYELPYMRSWHPVYAKEGGVPGFETVKFSIISHRGCPGQCNFCSLYFHQGRIIQSRSPRSILKEIHLLSQREDFRGTISDIGGPTANLVYAFCALWKTQGACQGKRCLFPDVCKNLKIDYQKTIELLQVARRVPKVKNVFVASGIRCDLLVKPEAREYVQNLCAHHISGQLKVAPEHNAPKVLQYMGKPDFSVYEEFVRIFQELTKKTGKRRFLVNYFLSAHPGTRLEDALRLALYLAQHGIHPEQVQDFIPLPMTASSCMYYTQQDPFTGKNMYVAKGSTARFQQRALIQFHNPKNRRAILEALRLLNRPEAGKVLLSFRKPVRKKENQKRMPDISS